MMQKALNRVYDFAKKHPKAATAVVLVTNAGTVFAQTADPTEQAITDAKTKILGYVAVGGGAIIAIALASVGWSVGGKLIKRLRGAA